MAESDGLDEAAEHMLRVALTSAAQLAERLAHARAQAAREAQARSDRDAREHTARVEAEHRAARAQLALTRDPRWWDTATGREIADAYATARQWADLDPAAARDANRITRQVRERYGPTAVPDATAQTTAQRLPAARRVGEQAANAETAVLLAAEARANVASRTKAWFAEPGHQLPPELTVVEAVEAVDARLRAVLDQARPAAEATAPAVRPTPLPVVHSRVARHTIGVDVERS